VPNRIAPNQLQVDEVIEEARLGMISRTQAVAPLSAEGLARRLSEELAYVARLLESLGDDLSADPVVIGRHTVEIQSLDIAVQILCHLATVIAADHPDQAIGKIGMDELRNRLQRVSLS
jgi:hypothetical protein